MSGTDEDLVRELREGAAVAVGANVMDKARILSAAADAIERLTRERDEARKHNATITLSGRAPVLPVPEE